MCGGLFCCLRNMDLSRLTRPRCRRAGKRWAPAALWNFGWTGADYRRRGRCCQAGRAIRACQPDVVSDADRGAEVVPRHRPVRRARVLARPRACPSTAPLSSARHPALRARRRRPLGRAHAARNHRRAARGRPECGRASHRHRVDRGGRATHALAGGCSCGAHDPAHRRPHRAGRPAAAAAGHGLRGRIAGGGAGAGGEARRHLDVYPPQADAPVRIEFFGPEVDSIRSFDVDDAALTRTHPGRSISASRPTSARTQHWRASSWRHWTSAPATRRRS